MASFTLKKDLLQSTEDHSRIRVGIGVTAPQGPTRVGTGNGTPEVLSAWGYTGQPCLRGYKYGDLVRQVGGWEWG
jgi:hypothetical protein